MQDMSKMFMELDKKEKKAGEGKKEREREMK